MLNTKHKNSNSINTFSTSNNNTSNANTYKQANLDNKNYLSQKNTTRENFYKEFDTESNYVNKENENVLRKSTDFYLFPKIKHQNTNEDSYSFSKHNLNKNKTININHSNTVYNNNIKNENMNENINITESDTNTFFFNPRERNDKKNYNFVDESYNWRFKQSPRKSMVNTNFNNTSNINLNSNLNENSSINVTQKKFDFKSIIDNEKMEEEKRMQQFFQKLNMSSINNFASMKNLNINVNPNYSMSNMNYNNSSGNLNNIPKNSNSEEKNNNNNFHQNEQNLNLNNQMKRSSSNSLIIKKDSNINNSNTNFNFHLLNQFNNFTSYIPKNNFDAIRPKMINSAENVLNSLGTIKNRNKLKIINKKLQISKEVPIQSYMITNIKPPCLFDFNNKLKGRVVMKRELELQKQKTLKNNPEAYYEDEEIQALDNENEEEKEKDILIKNNSKETMSKIKSNRNSSVIKNKDEENINEINSNKNNNKGIILNYLDKDKDKKSSSMMANANEDNSFCIPNNETNFFLHNPLNDISENQDSSDLNSSFQNGNKKNIKDKFISKFSNEVKLLNTNTKVHLKSESNYFYEKEEKGSTDKNTPFELRNSLSRKLSSEKNSFGPFFMKKPTIKDSEGDSSNNSLISLEEEKIHNLDDSGVLQVRRHESLYIKATKKINKGKNNKELVSNLSIKSPSKSYKFGKNDNLDSFSANPINSQILNKEENNITNNNIIANSNQRSISNNSNVNLNKNSMTINQSNNKQDNKINIQTMNSSNNKQDFSKTLQLSSKVLNLNYNILDKKNENTVDLSQHNFEVHEVEPNVKTKNEISKIKNDINALKKKRFDFKNEFLNDVHKRLQKKAFEINPDYESTKDIFLKYRQEKILEKSQFTLSSRLYLQNRNPIFQINNMISFPLMIDDPVFLANIYNVNMFKMENTAKNKIH